MKKRTAPIAVAVVALALIGTWLSSRWVMDAARQAGAEVGAQTRDRLQLVWPDLQQMPDADRLVLANLAMRCRLHEEPPIADTVVHCLARATAEKDAESEGSTLLRLLPPQYTMPSATR